ncbi:MAG: hypothetical protein HUU32_16565 [Calditrichaceae bacterium]|nr:hypothetical protein [Calditrichia bacterium]NUQ43004.1 hypothetical protein [Calditrichaceae bacterium]
MGWVKENIAGESGEVEGLIISETVDESIRYALVCVSNISLNVYHFEDEKVVFLDAKYADYVKTFLPKSKEEKLTALRELAEEVGVDVSKLEK